MFLVFKCPVFGSLLYLVPRCIFIFVLFFSKPFSYAICLNELGPELVHEYVSHEPSGRNFNEICLDQRSKWPFVNDVMGVLTFVALIIQVNCSKYLYH